MRRWHPLRILAFCWLAFISLLLAADCFLKPDTTTFTEAPTRIPLTVLPERNSHAFATLIPAPTLEPTEGLPRVTVTRVPASSTPTMAPSTATPTARPPQTPVQRG